MKPTRLHLYARLVSLCTLALIFAGGLVTSTGSGLSVPDWPLSYGTWMPPMIGGIRFEHSHRVIAGFVGLLTVGLALFAWRADERLWVRNVAIGAVVMVALQAVLGGLTVIYLLPDAISVSHACLAQAFFSVILALTFITSPEWRSKPPVESPEGDGLKRLLALTTSLVFLQLVAGAVVRHTQGAHGLEFHIALAVLIPMHALFVVQRLGRDAELHARFGGHALALGALVVTQVLLGLASFIFTQALTRPDHVPAGVAEVFFRTAHHTNGAAILGGFALLTLRVFRALRPSGDTAASYAPARERGVA